MKKTICGKNYDTETAQLIRRVSGGTHGGEDGYEETLYRTDEGLYFFYCNGGEASPYPKEEIKRVSRPNAEKWLSEHE